MPGKLLTLEGGIGLSEPISLGSIAPESRLTSCSVFRQGASMEAEIDCRLQFNSGYKANQVNEK